MSRLSTISGSSPVIKTSKTPADADTSKTKISQLAHRALFFSEGSQLGFIASLRIKLQAAVIQLISHLTSEDAIVTALKVAKLQTEVNHRAQKAQYDIDYSQSNLIAMNIYASRKREIDSLIKLIEKSGSNVYNAKAEGMCLFCASEESVLPIQQPAQVTSTPNPDAQNAMITEQDAKIQRYAKWVTENDPLSLYVAELHGHRQSQFNHFVSLLGLSNLGDNQKTLKAYIKYTEIR